MVSLDPSEAVAVISCWSLMVLPDSSVLKSNPRNSLLKVPFPHLIRSLSPAPPLSLACSVGVLSAPGGV